MEHDAEKWEPVFKKRTCSNKKVDHMHVGHLSAALSCRGALPTTGRDDEAGAFFRSVTRSKAKLSAFSHSNA
jgi:hypothetical protein